MTTDRLTSADVAALLGINPGTWRSYVSRGQAPERDGMIDNRTPYWLRSTVETWTKSRTMHESAPAPRERPGAVDPLEGADRE